MRQKSVLYAESWNVAWRKAPPGSVLNEKKEKFIVIKNPKRYWVADPFLFEHRGEVYVFAEMYDYVRRRGGIGYYHLTGKKKLKWIPVIFEDYHISYPYIFEKDGDIYIMPESSANKSLYLYKAVCFPDKWVKEKTIREGIKLADTSLLDGDHSNLALSYNVEDPHSPKLMLLDLECANNDTTVKTGNVLLQRPAGKTLPNNVRPAQIYNEDYGKGLVFLEYTFNHGFSEKEIHRIYPQDLVYSNQIFLDGMHTYNYCTSYEVIDIKTRRFNLLNLFFRLVGKLPFK